MRASRGLLATLAVLVATLLLASLPPLGRAALVEATSWIDAPLDGATLPPAPYEVVAHSADQGGVAEIVFEVDGTLASSQPADGSSRLVTGRFRWVPPGPGTYTLTVRARGPAGEWGAPASATVVIAADAGIPASSVDPGSSPVGSAVPSAAATASLAPGQTQAPRTASPGTPPPSSSPQAPTSPPTRTQPPTSPPTRTQPPAPTPTYCPPPTPILDAPTDFVELDYPSEAQPLFEWHYSGGTGCLASQVLHIYDQVVGIDLTIELGAGARSYQQRTALPWDPDNTGDRSCAHYHWEVTGLNADGDGEPSAPGSFKICELNPDA